MGESDVLPKPNGTTVSKDAPWWIKEARYFLAVIGIPGAICAFLLWERSTVVKEFTATMQKVVPLLEKIASKNAP